MILAFAEHDDASLDDEVLEALTLARGVADQAGVALHASLIGPIGDGIQETLSEYGVETLHVLSNEELEPYVPGGWAAALDHLIETTGPEAVIGAGLERTHEVFARLGARRGDPVAANCNEVTVGETYEVVRQRWGGSLLEEARIDSDPKLLSVTPHEQAAVPADTAADLTTEEIDVDLSDADMRVRIDRVEEADIEGVPLGEARVVVGGGRGVGSAEDFDQLEELAELLGGTVGSSRAAVNEGWRPHDDQIGLTGAKISPELYMPCGISGAVQHWVGCKGAKHLLAVNTDPEAAIIQKSDWAVIGDLHEVIPAVIEELEARGNEE